MWTLVHPLDIRWITETILIVIAISQNDIRSASVG